MTASEIKGWRSASISEVANVVRGSSPRPAKDPRYFNGSFLPWITVGDIVNSSGPYLERTESMLTEEGATHTRIMEAGTFLLTNSGARTLGVPKITLIRAGANDGVAALLNLASCINREFLFYQLQGQTVFFRQRIAAGNDQLNLNTDLIGALRIQIPPLPEQQKISAILSTWDRAIELTEKLIAAKQKRKQALMQQLLTEPLLAIRHSHQLKGWKSMRLGALIEKRTETSSDQNEFPLHSFTIEDGVTAKTDRYERSFLLRDSENNQYSIVRFGDFVINPMNIRFGAIGRSKIQTAVTVSAYYDVFRVANETCDANFLEHLLKSPLLMHTYETIATGSLLEKKRVHFSEFSKIQLPLPSIEVQLKISAVLNSNDAEIKLHATKVMMLKKQKKGLMQQLLTGKVRVKVEADTVKG